MTDGTPSGTPSTPDLPGIGPRNLKIFLNLPQSASIYLPLHLFSLLFLANAKMPPKKQATSLPALFRDGLARSTQRNAEADEEAERPDEIQMNELIPVIPNYPLSKNYKVPDRRIVEINKTNIREVRKHRRCRGVSCAHARTGSNCMCY